MIKKTKITTDVDIKPESILRRYLSLPKYLDLLRTSSIYLSRVDNFPDKFEGALPPAIREGINEARTNGHIGYDADDFIKRLRENIYLSCWSLGVQDNMALWQLYGTASNGIAITTTNEKLIEACLKWAEHEYVEIFKVKYIDHFKNPDMIIGSYSDPLRFKHKAYQYEKEVRVVVSRIGRNAKETRPSSLRLPVNLSSLIRSVVVAPEAGSWFYDLVSDITARYGLEVPVRRSKLTFLPK